MFSRNDLFFSITKKERLHVKVNLDFWMSKDIRGLRHMVLVAHGFLLVVFAFKESYKYGCNNPLQCAKVSRDALGNLGRPKIKLLLKVALLVNWILLLNW